MTGSVQRNLLLQRFQGTDGTTGARGCGGSPRTSGTNRGRGADDQSQGTTNLLSLNLTTGDTFVPGGMSSVSIKETNDLLNLSRMTIMNVTSPPTKITLVTGYTGGSFGDIFMLIRKLD